MVELSINARIHPQLLAILRDLGPVARLELLSVGGEALAHHLRAYLRQQAPTRHETASRLGATPTGHIAKGAARVTNFPTPDSTVVSVPIAGISRAFHDLTIRPKHAAALTIPVAAAAYGHRVRELRRLGWDIFRPKGKDFLMGTKAGDKEAQILYSLKKQVVIRKDRSLLPSDAAVKKVINLAIGASIDRHMRRKTA